MRLELGSTRALACADRRPRRSEARGITSPNGGVLETTRVVGEGANHGTRGRVRSPINCMDTAKGVHPRRSLAIPLEFPRHFRGLLKENGVRPDIETGFSCLGMVLTRGPTPAIEPTPPITMQWVNVTRCACSLRTIRGTGTEIPWPRRSENNRTIGRQGKRE
jgi:hypothetical protein